MHPTDHAQLLELGWNPWFGERFARLASADARPARVVADHGTGRVVHDGRQELAADLDRRLAAAARGSDGLLPVVGDWVTVRGGGPRVLVEAVVERRSAFRRKVPGEVSVEQVLAANVDVVLVVAGLDAEFNIRRIERYLAVAWSSGARPVVLLTKADLASAPDRAGRAAEASTAAAGAPVLAVSSLTGDGLDGVEGLLAAGHTAVLLGSSGVGKSTLVNRLSGREVMRTRAIRPDGRGRHTTSHRQLVRLPWGGLLIDTPGLRELQLSGGEEGVEHLFADVEDLAAGCRFADCSHSVEPGCAVRAAIASGELPEARLANYRRLSRDAAVGGERAARRREDRAALRWRRRLAQLRQEDWG